MIELAKEVEVFIMGWRSWQRLHLFTFRHTEMYTRGKLMFSDAPWKKREVVKYHLYLIFLQVLSLKLEVLRFPRQV